MGWDFFEQNFLILNFDEKFCPAMEWKKFVGLNKYFTPLLYVILEKKKIFYCRLLLKKN